MKFKSFICEDNFLQKIINFLRTPEYNYGKEFAKMCKKEAKLRWGEDLDKEFRSYGYCLLFSEHPKVWGQGEAFRAYISPRKDKLIVVCLKDFRCPEFLVYEKGDFSLNRPSYKVAFGYQKYDGTSVSEFFEDICTKGPEEVDDKYTYVTHRPSNFLKPFLFWEMEKVKDTIKISSDDYRENLSSDKLPDDLTNYFGDIISKKEMNTLMVRKCEPPQFVMLMRLMFVGNLPEKDCLSIASKYDV